MCVCMCVCVRAPVVAEAVDAVGDGAGVRVVRGTGLRHVIRTSEAIRKRVVCLCVGSVNVSKFVCVCVCVSCVSCMCALRAICVSVYCAYVYLYMCVRACVHACA